MAVIDQILVTLDPKIKPPILDVYDFETPGSDNEIRSPNNSGYARQLGKKAPMITIGNTRIPSQQILSMTLFSDSLIPTIHVSILDSSGSLTSVGYPKSNPLITAYVATGNTNLKSFCQTFLITNVHSIPLDGFSIRYDFFGELYIPKLNGNFIKSYSKMTSSSTLKKVAEELELGFATNEDSTNDTMTWINPNLNYKSFIYEVTDHAYKNETSFFDCFIDRYYIMNFINVEKQFKQFIDDSEITEGYPADSPDYNDTTYTMDGGSIADNMLIPLILTNAEVGSPQNELKILEYSLLGENGNILKLEGFRKHILMYKHGSDSPIKDWFSEPLSQPSTNGLTEYQTPELTDYLENPIVKWMGTDYSNSHDNYKFAKLLNTHNRIDSEKTMLKVKLVGFNQAVLRGSRVKVNIYSSRTKKMFDDMLADDKSLLNGQETNSSVNSNTTDLILDDKLSDTYYVKEIVYKYNPLHPGTAFTTDMILCRRNWVSVPNMKIIAT